MIRFSSAASMFLIRKKSITSTLDDSGVSGYFKPNESVDGIPSTVLSITIEEVSEGVFGL